MADEEQARWLADIARAHLRSLRVRVWMIILILSAGIMAFIPLFNLLGFGFSFALAIVASIASLDLGAAFVRRARDAHPDAGGLIGGLVRRAVVVNLALLIAPLVLIAVNGARVRNCDWWFGIQVYALLPGLSTVAATCVGVAVGLICGDRRKLSNVAPPVAFVASVVYAVWRFYAAPPVFSYNMFGGYFPGNLYDETIALRAPFYWARLAQFALIGAVLCAAALLVRPRSLSIGLIPRLRAWPALGLIASGGLAMWLYGNSGKLGFDIDAEDIKRALGGRYDTEHFTIYYPPGDDIERDIHAIAADHEFRFAQVERALGVEFPDRVTSFYFRSADDKYRLMGARNVYMAKPWRKEIYIHHASFPHAVVRHETVHVIAGLFGSPVFKVSARRWLGMPIAFNVGLIEGIAVAADWPSRFTRALTPHQSVKAMVELNMAPPLDQILSTGFLAFSSARSYTVAGSFVRFLLDRHGPEPLRVLYASGGDFPKAYGTTQGEMLRAWKQMIDEIELPEGAAEMVRERFRRPGIFSRPCPHAIARQRDRMAEHLGRGELDEAIALGRRVCDQAPHEPRYRLQLAALLARAGKTDEALTIFRDIAGDAKQMSSSIRAQALTQLVAHAARARDWNEVRKLLGEASELPLPDGAARLIGALRFAADHNGPAGEPLRAYFWSYDPRVDSDPMVILGRAAQAALAEPELGLAHYLFGRNLIDRGVPREAALRLARSLDLGLPSALLEREAARLLAEAAYLAGEFALVERAATIMLRDDQSDVIQLYGADWLERLYWKRTGRLPTPH